MKVVFLTAMQGVNAAQSDGLGQSVDVEVVVVPPPRTSRHRLGIIAWLVIHEVLVLPRILGVVLRQPQGVTLVCSTAHYAALMAHRLGPLFGKRTRVYLFNFYVHGLGRTTLVRIALRALLSGSVGICVYSPNEVDYFAGLRRDLHIDHLRYGGQFIAGVRDEDVHVGDYVFSGGYTNRDYETYVGAARRCPGTRFVLVCTSANRLPRSLPANLRVLRDVDAVRFHSLLAGSRCVVLALKEDVGSSGQMVALAAQQFGKLTLYTDYGCVSQYFVDGETGVALRPRDVDDLCHKLAAYAGDASLAARIGAAARGHYLRELQPHEGRSNRIVENVLSFMRSR